MEIGKCRVALATENLTLLNRNALPVAPVNLVLINSFLKNKENISLR